MGRIFGLFVMIVRRAEPHDQSRFLRMSKDAHLAGKLPFKFSAPHAVALFQQAMSMPDRVCVILASDDNVARGFLLGYVAPSPMADVSFARDFGWWIDVDHRGTGAAGTGAAEMLDEFELWADQRNATFVDMAAMEANPRAGRIYERRGYVKTETHFVKHMAPDQAA